MERQREIKVGIPDGAAESLLDEAIADLLARGEVEFPPYPAISIKIGALVRGGDFGLDELARLVTSDQSLASDVLRVAKQHLDHPEMLVVVFAGILPHALGRQPDRRAGR